MLHCDNLSTIVFSSNPVFDSRNKHLDTNFHFVREKVQKGDFLVQHISTNEQIVDILTKGFPGPSLFIIITILTLDTQVNMEEGGNNIITVMTNVKILNCQVSIDYKV